MLFAQQDEKVVLAVGPISQTNYMILFLEAVVLGAQEKTEIGFVLPSRLIA